MPERRDTLFKGRPKSGLDFLNAPRQSGNRTKSPVHSMGYGLCVDVQKSGTTQIQNVLDKGYNLKRVYKYPRLKLCNLCLSRQNEMHIFLTIFFEADHQFIVAMFKGKPLYHWDIKHICKSGFTDSKYLFLNLQCHRCIPPIQLSAWCRWSCSVHILHLPILLWHEGKSLLHPFGNPIHRSCRNRWL